MISVVIPLYNKEKAIKRSLLSVKNQSFDNFELIIVNDGSTDRSLDVVNSFLQESMDVWDLSKVKLISQVNQGVSSARNKGIELAEGEYIAFLDADDEWAPDYLEKMSLLINKYFECEVFAAGYYFKNGKDLKEYNIPLIEDEGILNNYFLVALSGHPPLWTSAIIVKKEALLAVDGFPHGVKIGQDIITWAKLACKYKIAYTKAKLAFYLRDDLCTATTGKNYQYIEPASRDDGGKILHSLCQKHPDIIGLKKYVFLWHKMRFVMLVNERRRKDAFVEYLQTIPYGLINMDCYYRLVLNLLPVFLQKKLRIIIKQ